MLYLLASFYNTKSDSLVGLRVINVFDDGNIGEFFDVTKEDMLELIQNDKAELYKVKNEDDLERWCRYTSMFDVETGNLINDMKYVKLNDTCYADSLGNVHKSRNLAELDNFVSNHKFTYLEDDKEIDRSFNEIDSKLMKTSKKSSKKEKSEDEVTYKEVCSIGKYEDIKVLTDKYLDKIECGTDIEYELLAMNKAGRLNYSLSDKKLGKIKPCRDITTGLYGVCCVYEDYIWVLLEPIYKQLESIQSNTSTYIIALNENNLWDIIDIKKNNKLEGFIDWVAVNNTPGKNGKVFVAVSGDDKSGYVWKLIGKGLILDREIGCKMVLSDVLFTKGRAYPKIVTNLEFYDPRHGETILINLKDYSMDSMMVFRKSFSSTPEKRENEEIALYYNIICDATIGNMIFETDKGFVDASIDLVDITPEFITSISSFLNVNPKDLVLDKRVKRHVETRHQYIYEKLSVDSVNKLKFLLSYFASYTSAKILGNYWTYKNIDTIEKALDDLTLDKFTSVSKCNDGKDLYYKASVISYVDKSLDLISFIRREGRNIRVEHTNLLDVNGIYNENLRSSEGFSEFDFVNLNESKIYDLSLVSCKLEHKYNSVSSKPTYDIVQKYKKNKLSLKCTEYKNVVDLDLKVKISDFDDIYNIYLKLYDGLTFKTSETEITKLNVDGKRAIEDVREHAKSYNKVLNENQPVISGFHVSAFKLEVM